MTNPDLAKLGLTFLKWSKANPYPDIPAEVGKEGAGENRVPFAHLANSVPTYLFFLGKLQENKKVKSVLDVGTGTGRNLSFVKNILKKEDLKRDITCIGIDYSKACIDYANSSYSEKYGIEFVQHSGVKFPFPDNTFDSIVSSHVLEHIGEKDAVMYFTEINRVLKPEGFAILGTPNRTFCQDLFCLNPKEIKKNRLILPHLHEYYYDELIKKLKSGYWKGKQNVFGTTNLMCRDLMIRSIDKIRPGKGILRNMIFEVYSVLRKSPQMQALMARVGTEFVMKNMNMNYEKLMRSTEFNEKNVANSDNFLIYLVK